MRLGAHLLISLFAVRLIYRIVVGPFFPTLGLKILIVTLQITYSVFAIGLQRIREGASGNLNGANVIGGHVMPQALVGLLPLNRPIWLNRRVQAIRNGGIEMMVGHSFGVSIVDCRKIRGTGCHFVLGSDLIQTSKMGGERRTIREGEIPNRQPYW